MPIFNASPFAAPAVKLIPGQPVYLFGKWAGDTSPTKLLVTAVASSTTVLTYYVTIVEGNIPVAPYGVLTVYGLATDPQFNVTNATITAASVSITASTGIGTLTVTGTGYTAYSKTADGGEGIIPQPEVGDALAANMISIPAGLPYAVPQDSGGYQEAVQCEVNFTGLTGTSACVVTLQAAMTNTPQTVWQTVISNVVTVAAGTPTYASGGSQVTGKWNFLRYALTGVTAGGASIIAKLSL